MDNLNALLAWGIGLVVVVPLLVVVVSEIIAQLERRNSVYTRFWRRLRDLVFPLATAFIIVRQMLAVESQTTGARLLETAVWATVAYTIGSLLSTVSSSRTGNRRWEIVIPGLFRGLLRIVIIAIPLYYTLSEIWGIELNDLFAALGVGSLVIALALQDTLSSIVSGFLITLDRPFNVGDQILINDKVGRVLDINWRSVRLQVNSRDVLIVPNSQLASESIYNFTAGNTSYRDEITVEFSQADSPTECKQVLEAATLASPYVMANPAPAAFLESFQQSFNRYDVVFFVDEFKDSLHRRRVRSDVQTRIYYAARRAGLTLAYVVTEDQPEGTLDDRLVAQQSLLSQLQGNPLFANLPPAGLSFLAEASELQTYGMGEIILKAGEPSNGLYVITRGDVELDADQSDIEVGIRLIAGSIFGEMVFLGGRPNPVAVRALTDVTVIFMPPSVVNDVLRQHPRFAAALDRLVGERQMMLQSYLAQDHAFDGAGENGTAA